MSREHVRSERAAEGPFSQKRPGDRMPVALLSGECLTHIAVAHRFGTEGQGTPRRLRSPTCYRARSGAGLVQWIRFGIRTTPPTGPSDAASGFGGRPVAGVSQQSRYPITPSPLAEPREFLCFLGS